MKKSVRICLLLTLVLILALSVSALGACDEVPENDEKCTITLDYDGATGNNDVKTISATVGKPIGALPTPTKENFEFLGWYLDGAKVEESTVWSEKGATATLVAKWQAVGQSQTNYTVTFVADGKTVATRTYTADNPKIEEPAVPAKTGYNGVWEKYSLDNKDITVKAEYTLITYTVTFVADNEKDGEYVKVDTRTYTVEDKDIDEPEVPKKAGCEGVWEEYELTNGDITVKAVYTKSDFTVTFVVDGETLTTRTYTVENKNIDEPAVPAKTGYDGVWEKYTLTTGDITVNAVYSAKKFVATLDYKDAIGGNTQETLEVTYDSAIGTLPTPTKNGYNFKSWKLNDTAVTKDTVWALEQDATLVADWEVITYKVTFKAEGSEDIVRTYTVENKDIDVPAVPDKPGYDGAWKDYTLSFGDITVEAAYNAKRFTVTLNYNGATSGNTTETVVVVYDSAVGSLPNPQKTGNQFDGWFWGKTQITSSYVWTTITEEPLTFDAAWTELSPVDFQLNDTQDGYVVTGLADWASKLEDLVVPETYKELPVTGIDRSAFSQESKLKSAVLPDSITIIGDYAFSSCTSLENVNIPDKVISIGENAFNGCRKLNEIVIPEGITSISKGTFAYCYNLTSVTLPQSLNSIDVNAFSHCYHLASIEFPQNLDKINGGAFQYCIDLTTITIPEKVTSVGDGAFENCYKLATLNMNATECAFGSTNGQGSFRYCKALQTVVIGDNVTSICRSAFIDLPELTNVTIGKNVKSIGSYAFANCPKLANLTFNKGEVEITLGLNAFYNCSGLKNITLPEKLTKIDAYAFEDCVSLESITIPENVTEIGQDVFKNCSALKTVNWNAINCKNGSSYYIFSDCAALATVVIGDKVTKLDGVFSGCKALSSVTFPESVDGLIIGASTFKDCTALTTVVLPQGLTKIDMFAFAGSGLTTITIPNSVTEIDAAFSGCAQLESITLPFVGTSQKTAADTNQYPFGSIFGTDAYNGCIETTQYYHGSNVSDTTSSTYYIPAGLKSVTITGGEILDGAFYSCETLTSITLPETITYIGSNAFYYCTSLTGFTVPKSVTAIGQYAFRGCQSIKNFTVEADNTVYNSAGNCLIYGDTVLAGFQDSTIPQEESITTIGQNAFYYQVNLTSIEIPSNITSVQTQAFYGCNNLTTITINANLANARSLFDGCTSLTNITLSDNITSIGDYMFANCTSLKSITIPESVTTIGQYAFYNCHSLESINIPDYVTMVGSRAFENCENLSEVTIGKRVKTMRDVFYNCTGITTVNWNAISCMSSPFTLCSEVMTLNIGSDIEDFPSAAFQNIELDNITVVAGSTRFIVVDNCLINVPFKKLVLGCANSVIPADGSVDTIERYAFHGCKSLTNITIPDSITTIGEYAFANSGLTSIVIPDSVTKIDGYTFANCSNLTSATLPNGMQTTPIYMFKDCDNLASIVIPESVTFIAQYSFSGCSSLTDITIPNGVTTISQHAFENCYALTDIVLPDSLTTIGGRAFYNCTGLTNLVIPTTVTTLESEAFSNCYGLRSVTLCGDSKLNYGVFYNCYRLVEVFNKSALELTLGSADYGYIGYYAKNIYTEEGGSKLTVDGNGLVIFDGNTIVDYIGTNGDVVIPEGMTVNKYAFYHNNIIESITIPQGVVVGEKAFENCTGLTKAAVPLEMLNYLPKITITVLELTSGTEINSSTFYNFQSLASLTIPASVESIASGSFNELDRLVEIFNKSAVEIEPLESVNIYTEGEGKLTMDDNGFVIYDKTTLVDYRGTESEITIPDGIRIISKYAFSSRYNLTSVVIPASVTIIGESAFEYCSNLVNVTIPEGVTTIGASAFYRCRALQTMIIPDSVTTIGAAAFSDTGIKEISIGNGVTSLDSNAIPVNNNLNYNEFDNALYLGNESNPYLVLVRAKSADITSCEINENTRFIYQEAFSYCSYLENIDIPDSVISIGRQAFRRCTALTSIVLPDGMTYIGSEAFYNCSNLASVTIGNVSEDTFIGNQIFNYCNNITRVTAPADLFKHIYKDKLVEANVTGGTSIAKSMFSNCDKLTSVTLSEGLLSIGDNAFASCDKLTNVTIPNSVTSIGNDAFKYCINLTEIVIPSGVTSIGQSAFEGCRSLTSIVIPDSVTTIGAMAFRDCENLANVTLGKALTAIGDHTFSGCSSLTSIVIPDNVTSIGADAFRACVNLENVTMGNGVKKIAKYAFAACYKLTSITIPQSMDSEECLDYSVFNSCYRLKEVYNKSSVDWTKKLPKNAVVYTTEDESKLTTDADGFVIYDNTTLVGYFGTKSDITIPDAITAINSHAFYENSVITSVKIGKNVQSIGEYAFYDCDNLTSVIISGSITTISYSTFNYCNNLTTVVLPDSLESIQEYSFSSYCLTIYYKGNAESWEEIYHIIDQLYAADVFYYSENEPALNEAGTAYDGNFWHEVEGEIVVWTKA